MTFDEACQKVIEHAKGIAKWGAESQKDADDFLRFSELDMNRKIELLNSLDIHKITKDEFHNEVLDAEERLEEDLSWCKE